MARRPGRDGDRDNPVGVAEGGDRGRQHPEGNWPHAEVELVVVVVVAEAVAAALTVRSEGLAQAAAQEAGGDESLDLEKKATKPYFMTSIICRDL